MATASLTGIDHYLAATYRPDCDYIDGEIQERNVGQFEHSDLQSELILYLRSRQLQWNIRVLPEQRLRVSSTRVRIPDVCILSREQPLEKIFTKPPLVCIEILSECDSLTSIRDRLDDYVRFGVPHVWVFDPIGREAWFYSTAGYGCESDRLRVADTSIEIVLADLFQYLD